MNDLIGEMMLFDIIKLNCLLMFFGKNDLTSQNDYFLNFTFFFFFLAKLI